MLLARTPALNEHRSMRNRIALIALPVALALFLGWWFHPRNVLMRRVHKLFDTAEVPTTMSEIARASRGPNLAGYLAEDIRLSPPDNFDSRLGREYSRDDAAAFYSSAAKFCRRISFLEPEFGAIEITDDRARVTFDIDAIAEFADRRPVDGILNMETTWVRTEEGWLLESAAWRESPRP